MGGTMPWMQGQWGPIGASGLGIQERKLFLQNIVINNIYFAYY
jgi:hypothetical protein